MGLVHTFIRATLACPHCTTETELESLPRALHEAHEKIKVLERRLDAVRKGLEL